VPFIVDGAEDLIEMPRIARPRPSVPQLIGLGLPEGPAPYRTASEVSMTPRSVINASTSRSLRQKRKDSHTPWLVTSQESNGTSTDGLRVIGSCGEHATQGASRKASRSI
jgi:hypothetical protein